jgi:hypothetical protein
MTNKCAVCDKPEGDGVALSIDPRCGQRGLPCQECIRMFRAFNWDPVLLGRVAEYLRKYKRKATA